MEIEWLDSLETRVRDAVARLGDLTEENRSLRDRIRDLETEVSVLSIPPAAPEGDGGDVDIDEELKRSACASVDWKGISPPPRPSAPRPPRRPGAGRSSATRCGGGWKR